MKFKTAIVGLGLLVIIFCTIQYSQGALRDMSKITDFMAPPDEHPWQDTNSPQANDTIHVETVPPIPVVIGPLKIIMMKPAIKIKMDPGTTQAADDRSYGRTPR